MLKLFLLLSKSNLLISLHHFLMEDVALILLVLGCDASTRSLILELVLAK